MHYKISFGCFLGIASFCSLQYLAEHKYVNIDTYQWRIQTLSLEGSGGFVLLALLTFLPSVISSFFNQNKGGGSPPGPSPRSATEHHDPRCIRQCPQARSKITSTRSRHQNTFGNRNVIRYNLSIFKRILSA